MILSPLKGFDAIIVTSSNEKQASAFQYELEKRKMRDSGIGLISKDCMVMSVPDPHGMRIGSGGATMNALLQLAERYSGLAGKNYVDTTILNDKKVCIIHSGGDSRRSPCQSVCGKAWSYIPSSSNTSGDLTAPVDHLLHSLSAIFSESPCGVVISCSDVSLILPMDPQKYDWTRPGITGLAIRVPSTYGPNHGVYSLSGEKELSVEKFLQKPSLEELKRTNSILPNDEVALDSGVMFFDTPTTALLLNRFSSAPLDASTYIGADRGASPIRIELYSDMILPLQASLSSLRLCATSKDEFLTMDGVKGGALLDARNMLWNDLENIKIHVNVPTGAHFAHVGTTREYVEFMSSRPAYSKFSKEYQMVPVVNSHISRRVKNLGVAINSIIDPRNGTIGIGSVVENCTFTSQGSELHLGDNCLISGIRSFDTSISLDPNLVMYETSIQMNSEHISSVVAVFGVYDDVKSDFQSPKGTYCNLQWSIFMEKSSVTEGDLWGHISSKDVPCLWNARIFPVIRAKNDEVANTWSTYWLRKFNSSENPSNLSDIRDAWYLSSRVSFADISIYSTPLHESDYKSNLGVTIDYSILKSSLTSKSHDIGLHRFCARASTTPSQLRKTLELLDEVSKTAGRLDITARSFTVIADVLACASGSNYFLRAGHSNNRAFQSALDFLKKGSISSAVEALAAERNKWMSSPDLVIRAARHYERAAQITISKAVLLAPISYKVIPEGILPLGKAVRATCPARIDLAGGWTDTPPITYEAGGTVLNAAITIDGKCPFTVIIKRIPEPRLELFSLDNKLILESLSDLYDYDQPSAPGALFKCVLIAMDVISLSNGMSLADQMKTAIGGGLVVHSESDLPAGSGLGGSSILAATIVGALARALGRDYSYDAITHIVLKIEQILTTGGGWQDQIGGIIGGVKLCESPAAIPICISRKFEEELATSPFIGDLSQRLILVYTGVARLAKNLLQDVIRRWYLAEPGIVKNTSSLIDNAHKSTEALLRGDLASVGECLSDYWKQKQLMAPNSRPPFVARLEETLSPLCLGISLAGAGGGGFMVCITKSPKDKKSIIAQLQLLKLLEKEVQVFEASIDSKGLSVELIDEDTK